jgi:hypothetical protein
MSDFCEHGKEFFVSVDVDSLLFSLAIRPINLHYVTPGCTVDFCVRWKWSIRILLQGCEPVLSKTNLALPHLSNSEEKARCQYRQDERRRLGRQWPFAVATTASTWTRACLTRTVKIRCLGDTPWMQEASEQLSKRWLILRVFKNTFRLQ